MLILLPQHSEGKSFNQIGINYQRHYPAKLIKLVRVCIHCPLHITDGGLWTQKSRPGHFAEKRELPLVLSLKPGVGQNIVMVVSGTVTVRYCAVTMHPELCDTVLSPCTQSCAILCCHHAPRVVRYCAVTMHPELCDTVLSPCTQNCAILCCHHAPRAVPSHEDWNEAEKQTDSDLLTGGRLECSVVCMIVRVIEPPPPPSLPSPQPPPPPPPPL